MTLRLYNTLTRTKEDFTPLDPANVRMYVCGPTVYDYAHIGNARPVIVFDVLFRLLRHLYGESHVTYARNITDVDDKINARARQEGVSIRELTERTARQFHADIGALGVLPPTVEPRATEHIAEMIAIIEMLIAKGHAYAADGHVLFDVPSMKNYGQLSRRSLDEMVAGARVDVAPYKRGDMDFVLWKPSDAETPGWDSPWGRGRPGWHIECSAMSWKHLGETFDIHGGGIDLIFPHHENEVAQNLCAFGHQTMASIWMHNGFLQVESQKMSKSLGNFVTIRELLRGWKGEPWSGSAIRLEMLGTHYRQPIDWTADRLKVAKATIQSLADGTNEGSFAGAGNYNTAWNSEPQPSDHFLSALSDDLNTPEATRFLRESISRIGSLDDAERIALVHGARFLGLLTSEQRPYLSGSPFFSDMSAALFNDAYHNFRDWRVSRANGDTQMAQEREVWFQSNQIQIVDPGAIAYIGTDLTRGGIDRLVTSRLAARKAKNWAESDRIRNELAAMGIAIMDNKDGTTSWEVRR